jgi:hypothetical protein
LILLNFGDSWAHADDAGLQFGYSRLVAKDLGYDYLDFSVPSSSIPGLLLQFRNFLKTAYNKEQQYTALFFITAKERQLLFDSNGKPNEIWPQSFDEYYLKWYNDPHGEFVANTVLLSLQELCRQYNIRWHFILGWQLLNLWPEVDRSKMHARGNRCIAQEFGGIGDTPLQDLIDNHHEQYLIYNNWHPSVKGHRLIADLIVHNLLPSQ